MSPARCWTSFAKAGFLNIAGGCCGTTPEHIARDRRSGRPLPAALPARRDVLRSGGGLNAGGLQARAGAGAHQAGRPRSDLRCSHRLVSWTHILTLSACRGGAPNAHGTAMQQAQRRRSASTSRSRSASRAAGSARTCRRGAGGVDGAGLRPAARLALDQAVSGIGGAAGDHRLA